MDKAFLTLVVLALAGCSDDNQIDKTDTTPSPDVSKGPWSLHVDETSAIVRWEALSDTRSPDLVFAPEGGGDSQTVTASVTPWDIPNTYEAAFALQDRPPDLAGTYYMHEAALTGLTAGTCYAYSLVADPTRKGRVCTSRPSGDSFKLVAVGDTNPGLGSTQKLLANVAPENYDLTLHEGDIQYYASGLETWQYWFGEMEPMLAQGQFLAAPGNHEYEKDDEFANYYQRFFQDAGFDGHDGYFRAHSGGVWFFSLNTELSVDPGTEQANWLETELADAAAQPGYRFSIVFFHRPFLTCGDTSQKDLARETFTPLFEQYKVLLVLQGHMHGYERFEVPMTTDATKTITYLTVAGGGGAIGDPDAGIDRPTCSMRVASGGFYHMAVIEVGATEVSGRVIDVDGVERDSFSKPIP